MKSTKNRTALKEAQREKVCNLLPLLDGNALRILVKIAETVVSLNSHKFECRLENKVKELMAALESQISYEQQQEVERSDPYRFF